MIIKNFQELSSTKSRQNSLEILNAGVDSVLPIRILQNSISFNNKSRLLHIRNKQYEIKGNIYVIGFGKAAGFMAEQIEKIIGKGNISAGIVISKTNLGKTEKIKIFKGSHPVPNEKNLEVTKKILSLIENLKEEDFVICLISGGGSAMFVYPVRGINLFEIRKLTELLLKCGAEVYEINILRKHLSMVKGGKLLNYLKPAKAVSIIFSDTIDTQYDATSSGPTSLDKSTFLDSYKILEKYNLLKKIPGSILKYIKRNMGKIEDETLKSENPLFKNIDNFIFADNLIALEAMKKKAEDLGYKRVIILTNTLKGESRNVAKKMGTIFRKASDQIVYLYAGETTVTVKGDGKGGRLQEYLASLIPEIAGTPSCVAASMGSDGVDFLEGIGGAIIDNTTFNECIKQSLDINKFLMDNDSYSLHEIFGNLIKSNTTNTNVGDLNVLIKN